MVDSEIRIPYPEVLKACVLLDNRRMAASVILDTDVDVDVVFDFVILASVAFVLDAYADFWPDVLNVLFCRATHVLTLYLVVMLQPYRKLRHFKIDSVKETDPASCLKFVRIDAEFVDANPTKPS